MKTPFKRGTPLRGSSSILLLTREEVKKHEHPLYIERLLKNKLLFYRDSIQTVFLKRNEDHLGIITREALTFILIPGPFTP